MPMMITEIQMFNDMNAKLTPTANASMLQATARKHVLPIEISGFLGVLFILFECFTHHVAADEGEQAENDPMVDGGHVFAERGGGEIAEQWEKRLKSAEPEGGFERVEAA